MVLQTAAVGDAYDRQHRGDCQHVFFENIHEKGQEMKIRSCARMTVAMVLAVAGYALVWTSSARASTLANYRLTSTISLPSEASEASAIAYNWDNGNLFVLGDEGDALVEITRTGTVVSTMTLSGFADTEGLTYIGSGQFVLTEERLRDAYVLTYGAGGSVDRSGLVSADLGTTVGNIGIEGIAYERSAGTYFTVKEKTPQEVNQNTINFGTGAVTTTPLFDPAGLGVSDLSDIAVLSNSALFAGTSKHDHLLIYSQESQKLLEVSRTGTLLSRFDFAAIAGDAEGVTIDDNGLIYIAGEAPAVYVLTPVPEPSTALMIVIGLAAIPWFRRRAAGWR